MSMVRMFHIQCDNCLNEVDGDEWYAEQAIERAKEEGFHVQGKKAICEECWDSGVRYKDVENS